MTKDEIMDMALEAGIRLAGPMDVIDPRNVYPHEIYRFAAVIAAAEREACAQLIEDFGRFGDTRDCAAAIRARGDE